MPVIPVTSMSMAHTYRQGIWFTSSNQHRSAGWRWTMHRQRQVNAEDRCAREGAGGCSCSDALQAGRVRGLCACRMGGRLCVCVGACVYRLCGRL